MLGGPVFLMLFTAFHSLSAHGFDTRNAKFRRHLPKEGEVQEGAHHGLTGLNGASFTRACGGSERDESRREMREVLVELVGKRTEKSINQWDQSLAKVESSHL